MHVLKLVELSAVLAHLGPPILYRGGELPSDWLGPYWVACRGRLDLWHQAMKRFQVAVDSQDGVAMRDWWETHRGVLQEVLASETLTRVVATLGQGIDYRSGRDEIAPITHAVHLAHLEARNRVQSAILDRRGCAVDDAVRLNRLRRITERWIDVLVGRLARHDQRLLVFGVDPPRTRVAAREARQWPDASLAALGRLAQAAIGESMWRDLSATAALPQANHNVAAAVMKLLHTTLFDDLGWPRSLAGQRLRHDGPSGDRRPDPAWVGRLDEEASGPSKLVTDAALATWFR